MNWGLGLLSAIGRAYICCKGLNLLWDHKSAKNLLRICARISPPGYRSPALHSLQESLRDWEEGRAVTLNTLSASHRQTDKSNCLTLTLEVNFDGKEIRKYCISLVNMEMGNVWSFTGASREFPVVCDDEEVVGDVRLCHAALHHQLVLRLALTGLGQHQLQPPPLRIVLR